MTPSSSTTSFALGESLSAFGKQQALEEAWATALLRLGMTEFPELTRVSAESRETLRSADYRRRVIMNFEAIPWQGVREATELGSPYIERDEATGYYTVYRLLRWNRQDIETARRRIAPRARYPFPLSPERERLEARDLGRALTEIRDLNASSDKREKHLAQIFKELKCGVTVRDLVKLIGKPDQRLAQNGFSVPKEYRWGGFSLWRFGSDSRIAAVTREGNEKPYRVVCPSRWKENAAF